MPPGFPILFARAIIFGDRASRHAPTRINSATATLLDLGNGPIAVTCFHVLAEYRKSEAATFQIGSVRVDPEAQLVSEDCPSDLATIRLLSAQAEAIIEDQILNTSRVFPIFKPESWPPAPVQEGDIVALAGFPAIWRKRLSVFHEFDFYGLAIGATRVTTVEENQFSCRFERSRWVWQSRMDGLSDLLREIGGMELGGMSGGPVFAFRENRADLVGFISQFSTALDKMYLKPASLIRPDGTIWKSSVKTPDCPE